MARRWQFRVPLRTWVVAVSLIVVIIPLLVVGILWITASPVTALAGGLLVSMGLSVGLVTSIGRLARRAAAGRPEDAGSTIAAVDAPPLSLPIARPRILLVEDDRVTQRVALRLLERLGVQADAVADGQPAVDAITTQTYALVLMDCQLPTLDGFAAASAIRQWERARAQAEAASGTTGQQPARRLPIVALTAAADEAARQRALDADMDDHLAKPLDAIRLAATLGRWGIAHTPPAPAASSAPATASPPAAASPSSTAPSPAATPAPVTPLASDTHTASAPATTSLPVLDPDVLPRVDGRLSAPYHEVVEVFLQEVPRRRRLLQEGLTRRDTAQVARVAHTLAGSAGSIGALRLAAACSALEALAHAASPSTPATSGQTAEDRPPGTGLAVSLSQAAEAVSQELRQLEAVLVRLVAAR